MDIFDLLYEKFKINKPIRLIELFSGYGSQALSLKYMGANFEHYKICEWKIDSIIAYADLHQDELEYYGQDFCADLTKEQIVNELVNYSVSKDGEKPAERKELIRMQESKLRLLYNSIWWTNNLVDVVKTHGKDLSIKDTKNYTYLLTYSFPCQNLSLAGKKANLKDSSKISKDNIYDTENRSNMLWQVQRILRELKENNMELPQILLMENVIQLHSKKNKAFLLKWELELENLGYKNYLSDMIATDYGVPQTRKRTFMVSILGDYNYKFPKKTKLKICLNDVIEENVDKKYFLTDKQIEEIRHWNAQEKPLEKMEIIERESCAHSNYTLTAEYTSSMILIKNATKKGYLEAENGDGIDISGRMVYHRGTVQKGKAQTITTMGGSDRRCSKGKYP